MVIVRGLSKRSLDAIHLKLAPIGSGVGLLTRRNRSLSPNGEARCLAIAVQRDEHRDCGCPKDHAPFAEFRWADFLRVHLNLDLHRSDPALAIKAAKRLIRDAWCKDPCAECRCKEAAVS